MREYIVVTAMTTHELSELVNRRLSEGYILTGGVSVTLTTTIVGRRRATVLWYAQALSR